MTPHSKQQQTILNDPFKVRAKKRLSLEYQTITPHFKCHSVLSKFFSPNDPSPWINYYFKNFPVNYNNRDRSIVMCSHCSTVNCHGPEISILHILTTCSSSFASVISHDCTMRHAATRLHTVRLARETSRCPTRATRLLSVSESNHSQKSLNRHFYRFYSSQAKKLTPLLRSVMKPDHRLDYCSINTAHVVRMWNSRTV